MKAKPLVYTAVMAALITVCAWITIPTVVPFTLQTFAIFLAVGVLGGKLGSLAVGVYLLMGAVGLPVFSGFSGGLGSFAGVTGGYLVGFLLIALVMWPGGLSAVRRGGAGGVLRLWHRLVRADVRRHHRPHGGYVRPVDLRDPLPAARRHQAGAGPGPQPPAGPRPGPGLTHIPCPCPI